MFNRPKAEKNIPDKAVSKLQIKEGIFKLRCIFGIKKEFLYGQKSRLKPPSRDLARTVYTAENLNLHIFFCNDVKFKSFWVKMANSPQTGTQAKRIKNKL